MSNQVVLHVPQLVLSVLLLAATICPPRYVAAQDARPQDALPFPGGVIERDLSAAYVTAGTADHAAIAKIDCAHEGRIIWSKEAPLARPLALVDGLVAVLSVEGQLESYALRLLALDCKTGSVASTSQPVPLPPWALPSRGHGHSLEVKSLPLPEGLLVFWHAEVWYSGDRRPADNDLDAGRKQQEGAFVFKPKSGETAQRSVSEAMELLNPPAPEAFRHWLADVRPADLDVGIHDPNDIAVPTPAVPGTCAHLATDTLFGVVHRAPKSAGGAYLLSTFDRRAQRPGAVVELPRSDGPPQPTLDHAHLLIRRAPTFDTVAPFMVVYGLERLGIVGTIPADGRIISAAVYGDNGFDMAEHFQFHGGTPDRLRRTLSYARVDDHSNLSDGRASWKVILSERDISAPRRAASLSAEGPEDSQ
jgi:hypothetical protein